MAGLALAAASLSTAKDSRAALPNQWIGAYTSYPSPTCLYDAGGHFVYAFVVGYQGPVSYLAAPLSTSALSAASCNAVGTTAYAISYCNTTQYMLQTWVMLGYFQNSSGAYPFHEESIASGGWPTLTSTSIAGYGPGGSAAGSSCGTITGYVWGANNPTP